MKTQTFDLKKWDLKELSPAETIIIDARGEDLPPPAVIQRLMNFRFR